MRIQHNIAAMNSLRQLTGNNNAVSKSLEKLSSGYRINRAGDDAAGLAISEKMRAQIRGLSMASKNAQDGISLVQTAEGALTETHSILQRMRELAVQASNGIYANEDREQTQLEIDALKTEVDRISTATTFNGIQLLDGTQSDNGAWKAMQGEEGLAAKIAGKIETAMNTETGNINTENGAYAADVDAFEVTSKGGQVGGFGTPTATPGKLTINFAGMTNVEKGDTLVIGDKKFEFVNDDGAAGTTEAVLNNDAEYVKIDATGLAGSLNNLVAKIKTELNYAAAGAGSTINGVAGYGEATVNGSTIVITTKGEEDTQELAGASLKTASANDAEFVYTPFNPGAGNVTPFNATASVKLALDGKLADGSTFEFAADQSYKLYTTQAAADASGEANAYVIGETASAQLNALNDLMVDYFTTKGVDAELASDGTLTVMAQNSANASDAANLFGTVSLDNNYEAKTLDESAVRATVYAGLSADDIAELKGYGITSLEANWSDTLEKAVKAKENGVVFQIGANGEDDQRVEIEIGDMGAEALGIKDVNLKTQEGANAAIKTIDAAINAVSAQRAQLGALQNRLEHTINNLDTNNENLTASESRIRDVDMAAEMMKYTQNNVLVQAAQSMLAQANQQPQSVLSLLQ